FANSSQFHSPKPTLSFITNSLRCSSVQLSALSIQLSGISLYPSSVIAFKRIFPPKGYILPSTSVTQTILRFSIISGNVRIDSTSFWNLSSLISRGLFGFGLIWDNFIHFFYTALYSDLSLFGSRGP